MGPLDRANLNYWIQGPNRVGVSLRLHLRTEADPASRNVVILDFRTMDKVQKPISSQLPHRQISRQENVCVYSVCVRRYDHQTQLS
jgi:hypothetical protein